MMQDDNHKPNRPEPSPAELEKLLEIELMQKRAGWQQAKARGGAVRALSFLFLFLVIMGALAVFYFFFASGRMRELKSHGPDPTPTPQTSDR